MDNLTIKALLINHNEGFWAALAGMTWSATKLDKSFQNGTSLSATAGDS